MENGRASVIKVCWGYQFAQIPYELYRAIEFDTLHD